MIVMTALKTLKMHQQTSKKANISWGSNPHSGSESPPEPYPSTAYGRAHHCVTIRPLPKIRPPLYKILDPPQI